MRRTILKGWLVGPLLASVLILVPGAARADVDFGLRAGVYTDVEDAFIGGEVLFPVGRAVFLNPNFEYVFVDDGDLYTLNLDFHYDFWSERDLSAWAGAGLAFIHSDFPPPRGRRDDDDDETEFGVNLLAGLGLNRGTLRPYVQGKVILADDSEFVAAVGVRFP